MIKLDPKRSHGTVYGVPGIHYQQDDILFDISGHPVRGLNEDATKRLGGKVIDPANFKPEEIEEQAAENDKMFVKEFLLLILNGGPVLKSDVYKETEQRNLDWDLVRTVAGEMSIKKYTRKSQEFWQLNLDAPSN